MNTTEMNLQARDLNEIANTYADAKSLGDDARQVSAAVSLIQIAVGLVSKTGPIPTLSIDPQSVIKAADKISLAQQMKQHGVENDPEVRKLLGLPPIDPMDQVRDKFRSAIPIPDSPIILDLDGDGVETNYVKEGAHFDHAGDGFAEQTGWVDKDDGLLVRDLDNNGKIDTGRELFGSETILVNGNKASNGFVALAELDTNHDGKVDASDDAFNTLKIWKDLDSDGYTDEGELLSLFEANVQSVTAIVVHTGKNSAELTRFCNRCPVIGLCGN